VPSAAPAARKKPAAASRGRHARTFKGILRFIAGRRCESNASAEYFRSYEMRVERRSRPGNLSYLPAETYLSSRPINVPGPRLLFFPPRDIRPRFKILHHVPPASISSPLFTFPFHSLRPPLSSPLVSGHFLLFTSLSVPSFRFRSLVVPLFLFSQRRGSRIRYPFSLAICSPLFNVAR